jgi:hypothetical protein
MPIGRGGKSVAMTVFMPIKLAGIGAWASTAVGARRERLKRKLTKRAFVMIEQRSPPGDENSVSR